MASFIFQAIPASAGPSCVGNLPDATGAVALAKACGIRVEIDSARTETGQVFINPDGTTTVEESAYPQRVKRAGGTWADLDSTLTTNPDGSLSPRASIVDLNFSGGGTGPVLTGRRAGQSVALSWRGKLPKPTVAGSSATYAEVLPGVDLVVTAHDNGFSEVVVVKNRAAAANPALRSLAFDSSLGGLHWVTKDGDLQAVDASGRPALAASAPRMWDASAAPAGAARLTGGRARGDVSGPAEGGRTAPIQLGLNGNAVTLTPDAAMLDDALASSSIEYPLYLDPTITYSSWTMINSQYTTQSYWSYDKTDCPSGYSTECAKVGQIYGGTMDYRSMFQFATSSFHSKQILASKFTIDLLHSASTSNSVTELRQINAGINSGTTWSNNASAWSGTVAASVSNTDNSDARKLSEFSGGTLNSLLQTVANSSGTTTTWGLKANTETSSNAWKKFDAKTARLVVTTNTAPATPDTLTVDGKACVAGANRPFVATATPVLRSRTTDPDGDSMIDYFAYAKWNGTSFVDVGSSSQATIPNGGYGQITTTALEDNGIYTFRSQSNDSPSHAGTGYGTSPVTNVPGNCEWQEDLVDPVVPGVTSDVYTENCASCGSVGQTGHFTFGSSADVVSYRWGWSSPPTTVATPAALGGTVSIDWTPPTGGPKTLFVQAIDRAGRTATKNFQFYVAPPSTAVARWKLDDAPGATELADDTGHGNAATLHGGATLGVPGRIVPGLDGVSRTAVSFDGVDDYAVTPHSVLADTSKSFTVSAWVKLADTTVSHEVLSQGGNNNSSFVLEYHSSGHFKFTTTAADLGTTTYLGGQSTTVPKAGVWYHVTGVYDSAAKTSQLYVNGALEASATGITTWDANGGMVIGGSVRYNGSIGEVQVWNRVLSPSEVFDLSDPLKVSKVGEYHFDEVGPGPAYDASGLAHDLSFYYGASVPASGAGQTGTGLLLDGVDDYAAPDGPVLATDQSFTASAWVRLTDKTVSHNILVQMGATYSPFYLQYNVGYDRWLVNLSSQDADPVSWSNAPRSTSVPALNTWTHLVAVYDAAKGEIRLYVNGVLEATSIGVAPWASAGQLLIGEGFVANIDEVRVYQGAVTNVTSIP